MALRKRQGRLSGAYDLFLRSGQPFGSRAGPLAPRNGKRKTALVPTFLNLSLDFRRAVVRMDPHCALARDFVSAKLRA